MCDKNHALEIFKEACSLMESIFPNVNKAYLYGSYARGDYHNESDIDILFVVPLSWEEINAKRSDYCSIAGKLSLENDITVSITIKPKSIFDKWKDSLPFYMNVVKEGVLHEYR